MTFSVNKNVQPYNGFSSHLFPICFENPSYLPSFFNFVFFSFRNRIIPKRINVRIEHIKHSKCRDDFLRYVSYNCYFWTSCYIETLPSVGKGYFTNDSCITFLNSVSHITLYFSIVFIQIIFTDVAVFSLVYPLLYFEVY